MNWLKTAISTGAFEEQTAEDDGSCSLLCQNDLDQSLENPKHQSVLSQPLTDNETASKAFLKLSLKEAYVDMVEAGVHLCRTSNEKITPKSPNPGAAYSTSFFSTQLAIPS